MKYLKKYKLFEDDRFDNRDVTNYLSTDGQEHRTSEGDRYIGIEKAFGINKDELGYILVDFIEEYSLSYKCEIRDGWRNISFPKSSMKNDRFDRLNISLRPDSSTDNRIREWLERKIGHAHVWNWDLLAEINDRLKKYNLTIKDDDIYQIYVNNNNSANLVIDTMD